MRIELKNNSIDFSTKSLDEAKILIVNGGRRFKGKGFKNVRLNDLIKAVLRQLKNQKSEDLDEAKDLLDRFTKIANKGYEPDGKFSKLPITIRWIANVKHLYGQWRRKHLLKDLKENVNYYKDSVKKIVSEQKSQRLISNQRLESQQQGQTSKLSQHDQLSPVQPQETKQKSESSLNEIPKIEKGQSPSVNFPANESPDLPDEMLLEIFTRAAPEDIANLSQVNKQYLKVSKGRAFKQSIRKKLYEIAMKKSEEERFSVSLFRHLMDYDQKKAISVLNKVIDEILNNNLEVPPNTIGPVYYLWDVLNANLEKNISGTKVILEKLQSFYQKRNLNEQQLAGLYARIGNFQEAKLLTDDSNFNEVSLEIHFTSILEKPDEAKKIIENATIDSLKCIRNFHLQRFRSLKPEQVCEIIQLIQQKIGINSSLILAYTNFGNQEFAWNSFQEAMQSMDSEEKNFLLDTLDKDLYLTSLSVADWIKLIIKDFELQKSLAILDFLVGIKPDKASVASSYLYAVIEGYLAIGEIKKSEEIFSRPNKLNERYRMMVLQSLAKKKIEQKDNESASKNLEELQKLIKGHYFSSFHLTTRLLKVAKMYAEFDPKKARKLLKPIELQARDNRFYFRLAGVAEAYILIDVKKAKNLLREAEQMASNSIQEDKFFTLAKVWMKIDPQQTIRLCSMKNEVSADSILELYEKYSKLIES